MKDFLGNELNVGDFVLTTLPYYKHLVKAKVVRVTPKGATVEYYYNKPKTTSRMSNQLINISHYKQ